MPNQTGPRTDEGKSASSQNNRQHGFSTANVIVSAEEQPFFDQMEAEFRNEVEPDGPLENFAFRRLITAAWQIERCQQKEAALRQIRLLQTDRGMKCVSDNNWPEFFAPLADVPKIEQFARRIAKPVTFEDQVRKNLNTQLATMQLEE